MEPLAWLNECSHLAPADAPMIDMSDQPRQLLAALRTRACQRGLAAHTGRIYATWILRFLESQAFCDPRGFGEREAGAFLGGDRGRGPQSESTREQAIAALRFFYRDVLDRPSDWLASLRHPKTPAALPPSATQATSGHCRCATKPAHESRSAHLPIQ